MFRLKRLLILSVVVPLLYAASPATAAPYYYNDFDSGSSAGFSGIVSLENGQGFNGLGGFTGNLLRNSSLGSHTVLTLTNLPSHSGIDLDFLLAVIDSWDGATGGYHPDKLNLKIDGAVVFSEYFDIFTWADQSYHPTNGELLTYQTQRGFNGSFNDAAYNMGLYPGADNIPHTANTLTIEWYASGGGYQGGNDESFGIDNVNISLNGTIPVPEPASLLLLGMGGALVSFKKRT